MARFPPLLMPWSKAAGAAVLASTGRQNKGTDIWPGYQQDRQFGVGRPMPPSGIFLAQPSPSWSGPSRAQAQPTRRQVRWTLHTGRKMLDGKTGVRIVLTARKATFLRQKISWPCTLKPFVSIFRAWQAPCCNPMVCQSGLRFEPSSVTGCRKVHQDHGPAGF